MSENNQATEPEQSFEQLLEISKGLSVEEGSKELIDCSRWGETKPVEALLETFSEKIVNLTDSQLNTALHMACANGHSAVVQLLLEHKASYRVNESGNTPLHWAAAQGHLDVVTLLLDHFPAKTFGPNELHSSKNKSNNSNGNNNTNNNIKSDEIDVLQKNKFGKSVLTEAFTSQNTDLIKLILEHPTATEDRLIEGAERLDDWDKDETEKVNAELEQQDVKMDGNEEKGLVNEEGMDEELVKHAIIHEFALAAPNSNETLKIRELPIAHADNPFGETAKDDTTGYAIWCASLIMARWLASPLMKERFSGKSVLELGAGCGVPGFSVACYTNASEVYLTDLNPTTVNNLVHNAKLNEFDIDKVNRPRVHTQAIDWSNTTTWPTDQADCPKKFDFVIGSDLIYHSSIVPLLKQVVLSLLDENCGTFLYVCPDTNRDGLMDFLQEMKAQSGWYVNQELVCPDEFKENVLVSGDDEEFFLHFHEIASYTYLLYEFSKVDRCGS